MADWKALYPFASHWFTPPSPVSASDHPSAKTASTQADPAAPRLHYIDEGPSKKNAAAISTSPSDVPTIVCVHGNPTWSFTYREIVNGQRESSRVIAVDNMGCGLSDKPQHYPYNLDRHIDNLVGLIQTLDLRRITFVVHDWGGAIGLGAAVRVPERVSGLVVLNTAAFPPPYFPWRIRACRIPIIGNWAMRQLNLFARAALVMTINRLPRLPEDVASGLIAPYDSWHNRVAIARFVQDIPTRATQQTWQRLVAIQQALTRLGDRPIELVWGMQDWCFRPECLDRFEAIWPDAKVTRLNDVGHYVMEEAPGEVNEAVTRCLQHQAS